MDFQRREPLIPTENPTKITPLGAAVLVLGQLAIFVAITYGIAGLNRELWWQESIILILVVGFSLIGVIGGGMIIVCLIFAAVMWLVLRLRDCRCRAPNCHHSRDFRKQLQRTFFGWQTFLFSCGIPPLFLPLYWYVFHMIK